MESIASLDKGRGMCHEKNNCLKTLCLFKITGWSSKITLGPDHDIAQLDHGRNMYANFELRLQRSNPDKVAVATNPTDHQHAQAGYKKYPDTNNT